MKKNCVLIGLVATLGGALLWPVTAQAQSEREKGRQLFLSKTQPACALCHALRDAGAQGMVGPVLDDIRPDAARVMQVLKDGMGAMPSFKQQLSEAEMGVLSRYVAAASRGQK